MIGTLIMSPFTVGWWLASKMKDLTVAAWNKLPKPKSFFWKCIVYPLYFYVVIPGSIPYAFVKLAELMGYGEEMSALWGITTDTASGIGVVAIDAAIKGILAALWFLITYIGHL